MTTPPLARRAALLGAAGTVAALARPALATARRPPERVVCVGGALTEAAFALGAGDRVVAADSTSRFPAAARALPGVGYMRALPPEGVLSLRPDLLLLSSDAGPPAAMEVLRASRVPTAVVEDGAGGAAAVAKVRAVADALGFDAAPVADALAADWAALDAPVAALAARRDAPRVVFVLSAASGAPLASGTGTHAHAMIEAAGARNAVTAYTGYRPLSAEAAASLAPDAILVMEHVLAAAGGAEALLRVPALAVTPAAAARRLYAVEGSYVFNFGPRAAHARRDVAALLHGPGAAASLPVLPDRPWLRG